MKKLRGGSIYQRASDGLWCATIEAGTVDGKRRKRVVASKDRAVVEAKLREMNPNIGPVGHRSRYENMCRARAIATHTRKEWADKVRSTPEECRYCLVPMSLFNMVKDHMIAIEIGGSDGIDNVQPICWECNLSKRLTHPDKFVYDGPTPRPFTPMPSKVEEYERIQHMRRRGLGIYGMRK